MRCGRFVTFLLVAAALSTVAACGRRGPLETPYEASVNARKAAEKAGQPLPPEPEKPVEDKPFFLDRLIQ